MTPADDSSPTPSAGSGTPASHRAPANTGLRIAIAIIGVLIGGAIGITAGMALVASFPSLGEIFGVEEESSSTEVIQGVREIEEVALVSLSVQGIETRRANSQVFGIDVPGTGRVTFIQYSFDAKLGVDGADVEIEEKGENAFLVTMPEFIFIGYDQPRFEEPIEANGVLSWVTTDFEDLEIANEVLDDDAQREYLVQQHETLQEQAEAFYRSLILSIEPEATIEFDFAPPPPA